jgi:hypothetical protein
MCASALNLDSGTIAPAARGCYLAFKVLVLSFSSGCATVSSGGSAEGNHAVARPLLSPAATEAFQEAKKARVCRHVGLDPQAFQPRR